MIFGVRTRILTGLAIAASVAMVPAWAQASEFRRGISISHTMAWAEVESPPSKAFVFPPFADRPLRATELGALRRTGFDFVRLAVDPGPFLQFQGARRDRLDRILLEQIHLILSSGLAVIVDFHPSDLHSQYLARKLVGGVETPAFRDYLRLVDRTAALLDRLQTPRVALELFNEPPGSTRTWQPMLEAAYRVARRRARDLPLVLTGASEGMPEGLLDLKTTAFRDDPAVLYTFHYYEPFQFTHQGASWNDARYLADVPYPAYARPLRDSLDASAALIEASQLSRTQKLAAAREARRQLESYRRSAFDRTAISRSLDRIGRWGRDNGVAGDRILLGEFGVLKPDRQVSGPRAAERRQWFADVRAEAEARGFAWAVWTYRGSGGFALTNDAAAVNIDPAISAALGLTPPRRNASSAD
jgi:hypothetical protein